MIDEMTFGNAKALFHTLGCKLNFAETSTIARIFAEKGIRRIQPGETPDVIVVNTCSVTDMADKKCRQAIHRFSSRYPEAAIIVTGCYAQLKSDEIMAMPGVDIVAGTDRKLRLADYLEDWMKSRQPSSMVTPTKEIKEFSPSCSRGDRTRYFLKVQDGCDYWCTYCTIPKARGRSRSATIEQLVGQASQVAADGGREIVITGVNIGDFGKLTGERFIDLCRALDTVEGIDRYRISSIEPDLLTDEIINFVASSRRFMPHFHLPLQSGSDHVLQLMRRHYDTSLFASRIEKILHTMPDAFIGVDLITGAMGETPAHFDESLRFIERLPVSRLHVFPYSERAGTRALEIRPRVEPSERHERCRTMIAVSDRKLAEFQRRYEGTTRKVLVEHSVSADGHMYGFTDNYIKVEMPADLGLFNRIVDTRLTAGGKDFMKGIPAK